MFRSRPVATSHIRGAEGSWRPGVALAGTALALLVATSSALAAGAGAATLSPDEIQQLRAELANIRAESEAARAQEAAREKQIDALQRRLDAAAGLPPAPPAPAAPTAVAEAPGPVEVASGTPVPPDLNPEDNPPVPRADRFEIYGFAQADYIQDFKRVDPNWADTLRPSKIPTEPGVFGQNGQSLFSVKQTRFGVQGAQNLLGKPASFKFDFDLFGVGVDAGQTTFRLRHAYGQWAWFTFGQTESLFMDLSIFPNTIDYWGPSGMVFLRNPQFRVTLVDTPAWKFAFAIEKPGNDVDAGVIREIDPNLGDNLQNHNYLPDLTAQVQMRGGWGHVQVAGIARQLGYDTLGAPDNKPAGSVFGWGVNTTAGIKTFGRDQILAGVIYGHGVASYMNDGGVDLAPAGTGEPGSTHAEAAPLLGLSFYYDHYWSKVFSTSLGWSETVLYNTNLQEGSAFHSGQYASGNLLWTPTSNLLFGAEFLYGRRQNFDGAVGDDYRLQFSAKYSFSSKDWFQ